MGKKREIRIDILQRLYNSVGGFEKTLSTDEYFGMKWLSSKGLLNFSRQTATQIVNGELTFVDVGNKFLIQPTVFFLYLKYSLEFSAEDIYYEVRDFYAENRITMLKEMRKQ